MSKRDYDSTVARIAGNIASGYMSDKAVFHESDELVAVWAVSLARAIVAEVKRTEPEQESPR